MSPFLAEIMGTLFLILLGTGVVANVILKGTKGNGSGWIVIATGWALGVFVGVAVAGPYSGAHINPAVTISLAVAGKFPWSQVPAFILAQWIGASLGATLTWLMYRDHFRATDDAVLKLAVFCTIPAIENKTSNLISEVIGTFVLMFAIFYFTNAELGSDRTPIGLGSLGAVPVTFLVWAIGLSLGGTTGYAINPARDFAPRLMHAVLPIEGKGSSNWHYAWIPVAGPVLGGLLAALLYLCIRS